MQFSDYYSVIQIKYILLNWLMVDTFFDIGVRFTSTTKYNAWYKYLSSILAYWYHSIFLQGILLALGFRPEKQIYTNQALATGHK